VDARATAGAVTAGFSKEEILRKPRVNPRAEGGMFARLEALLTALLDLRETAKILNSKELSC
jgi:hypothetical protein